MAVQLNLDDDNLPLRKYAAWRAMWLRANPEASAAEVASKIKRIAFECGLDAVPKEEQD